MGGHVLSVRINAILAARGDNRAVAMARNIAQRVQLGAYFLTERQRPHIVIEPDIDLEALARMLGAVRPDEAVRLLVAPKPPPGC